MSVHCWTSKALHDIWEDVADAAISAARTSARHGLPDLLLVHQRDGPPEVLSYTGRYIQVLINDDGEAFVDETSTWIGDQSLTAPERFPNGDSMHNAAHPRMLDIDRDGCEDIVMANGHNPIRPQSPIFYLNNGSGQFEMLDPGELFTDMEWSGRYSRPADVRRRRRDRPRVPSAR